MEKEKARERQGERTDIKENFPESEHGQTRDIVAEQSGFGSGKQYEKAKYISENADAETIAKLDAGEISIHKAYMETKAKLQEAERRASGFEKALKEAQEALRAEREKPPVTKEVIVEKVVDHTDYQKIAQLQEEVRRKQAQLDEISRKSN